MENNNENYNKNLLSDKEFFDWIPLGYRFCPKDCELIEHYLKKKINGEKLPTNDFREICTINLHHPQELCTTENMHQRGDKWYFFTSRERKHKKGSKPNREVKGKGNWKATGVDAKITKNDHIIGYKMTLDFYDQNKIKSQWKMHEFRLDRKSSPPDLDKYVLCEIYINTAAKNDNNDEAANSPNIDNNIIDQDDPSLEILNMYPYEEKMEHEQNFAGFDNNLEFGGDHQFVQEITTPNLISSSSNVHQLPNYGDHGNVCCFQGFDELGAMIKGGARI
ncbi:NAC domain-containing protein 83-like [Lycium ferocissimum]|uniref:NAC domain-containing protein 83-like n=1 Tax=Lycium ferocissimum TaxID=112874 RepID=UPI002815D006|nr:NAC domain-containing protein 83-like [Lycium ferocissimum]